MNKIIVYYEDKSINLQFYEKFIKVHKLIKILSDILELYKEQEDNLFLHNSSGHVLSINEIISLCSKNNTYILKIYHIPYTISPKQEDLFKMIQKATNASFPIIRNISTKSQREFQPNPLLLKENSLDISDSDNESDIDFELYPASTHNTLIITNPELVFFVYIRTLLNGGNIYDQYEDDD